MKTEEPRTTVIGADARTKLLESTIKEHRKDLHDLSIYLSDHPELAFEETLAHDAVTSFLEERGFEVKRNCLLPTAFRASFTQGQGGRVWGLNSEYDALPDIGHACGHNLICISGIAALLAMRKVMQEHRISGTVVLIGTPAEEGGAGKDILLEKGAYKGLDACMMLHPGQYQAGLGAAKPSLSQNKLYVTYRGKASHAAKLPWEGVNALDAAVLAYNNISLLRQQIEPSDRLHGVITDGGASLNVIPERSQLRYGIRSTDVKSLEALTTRVEACFQGVLNDCISQELTFLSAAAQATGCTVEIVRERIYKDLRQCKPLAEQYASTLKELYGIECETKYHDWSSGSASTDFGNVTYALPGCHPHFGIDFPKGRGAHTREFEVAARTDSAHQETYKAATGMANVGIRFLSDVGFAEQVKSWWTYDMTCL